MNEPIEERNEKNRGKDVGYGCAEREKAISNTRMRRVCMCVCVCLGCHVYGMYFDCNTTPLMLPASHSINVIQSENIDPNYTLASHQRHFFSTSRRVFPFITSVFAQTTASFRQLKYTNFFLFHSFGRRHFHANESSFCFVYRRNRPLN